LIITFSLSPLYFSFLNLFNHNFIFIFKISDGGVHSHIDHLFSLIETVKELGVPKTFVQFFADGRDTRPTSGGEFMSTIYTLTNAIVSY
jgi:bisphosphoglycerate-independent phosphoglycerate mutase (AlkP superfamily)